MKKLRILPGAAGVIALTALIGFVDGQRDNEAEQLSRDSVMQVTTQPYLSTVGPSTGNRLVIKPGSPAYLVEIKSGETSSGILIDAATGQVLLS